MFNVGAFTKDLIEHVIIIGLPKSALPTSTQYWMLDFYNHFHSLWHTLCAFILNGIGLVLFRSDSYCSFLFSMSFSLFHTHTNITCFRWRSSFAFSFLWQKHTGSIQVAPMATLRLGPTFKADSIKEGDDVYFECSIQANPDVTRLVWKHEVSRHTWATWMTLSSASRYPPWLLDTFSIFFN